MPDLAVGVGQRAADAVEADAARHLLDEVDLAVEVGAERRRRSRSTSSPSSSHRASASSSSMPSGASESHTSSASRSVPSTAFTRLVRRRMRGALDRRRVHVDRVGRDLRAGHLDEQLHRRARRCAAIASGSMPRSKRALDSLRSFSRFELRAMPMRSKYADSSRISVVVSDTSDVAPPMIPAMACGARSASQISRSSPVSVRSTPSSVVMFSPSFGEAHDDAAPGEPREVERVQRLVAFEQHVVGDVDHVADRAHARLHQALRHPRGRLAHRDRARPDRGSAGSGRRPRPPR